MLRNKDGTPEFLAKTMALGASNVLSRRKIFILEYLQNKK